MNGADTLERGGRVLMSDGYISRHFLCLTGFSTGACQEVYSDAFLWSQCNTFAALPQCSNGLVDRAHGNHYDFQSLASSVSLWDALR